MDEEIVLLLREIRDLHQTQIKNQQTILEMSGKMVRKRRIVMIVVIVAVAAIVFLNR